MYTNKNTAIEHETTRNRTKNNDAKQTTRKTEQNKAEQQQKQSWNRLNTFTKTETELPYRKET